MKIVVQRVKESKVLKISGDKKEEISRIGKGLLVFLGVKKGDTISDAQYLAEKLLHLRCFDDKNSKMNLSVGDVKGEIMVVSEFTLYGDCRKGRRPDFAMAETPEQAKKLYMIFIEILKKTGMKVSNGEFKAYMQVEIKNDGPITFIIES